MIMFLYSFCTSIALAVFSFSNGSSVAGDSLNLTCVMAVVAGLSGTPRIEWRRPDGDIVTESDSIRLVGPIVEGTFSATLLLQFTPLMASHAGQYSCHATITGPGGSQSSLATEDVRLQR